MLYTPSPDKLAKLLEPYNVKDRLIVLNVRSGSKECDTFDDTTHLVCNGQILFSAESTCDPGLANMLNPVNPNGCAIVMNGYWKGLWKFGYHKGKYKAFVQNRPVIVFRDNDKDSILDYCDIRNDNPAVLEFVKNVAKGKYCDTILVNGKAYVLEFGLFGINCHRASEVNILQKVGLYSAGCCVIQDATKFNRMLVVASSTQNRYQSIEIDGFYIHQDYIESLK